MKKLLLPLAAGLIATASFAQVTVYNGEDTGTGMWDSFLTEAAEVDNPAKDAVNSTDKCLRISRIKDTEMWAGARAPRLSIPNITEYGQITMMVKKDEPGLVRLEIQTEGEARKEFLEAFYLPEGAGTWQKLVFNLPPNSLAGEPVAIILASIHFVDTRIDDDYYDQYMYLDEIVLQPKTDKVEFDAENRGTDMWDAFLTDIAIVDNPAKDETNATDKCLRIFRKKDMDEWGGARAPRFKVTNLSDYHTLTLMLKKDVPGAIRLELQTLDEGKKEFLTADYPAEAAGTWKKIEFPIPENALEGEPLSIILLSPHLVNTREDPAYTDQYVYVDEMYLTTKSGSAIQVPLFDRARIIATTVYNLTGEKVAAFGETQAIDLTSLAKGIYILEQTDENGIKNSRKVINE